MKKKLLAAGIILFGIVALVGAEIVFNHHDVEITDLSSMIGGNMEILRSIPIINGIEKPKVNEPKIANQLFDIFKRFASHNTNANGSYNRGTHAKGQCFDGTFTVFDREQLQSQFHESPQLAQRLKQGLFAESGAWPAAIRFANADGLGRSQDDTKTDVRGFSFSVQTPASITSYAGDHRQDFMNNSAPAFATGAIHEFLELVKIVNVGVYHDFTYIPNPAYVPSLVASRVLTHGNDSGIATKSFATQEYWDDLPYTHGIGANGMPMDLVKYKITPCDGKGSQHLASVDGLDKDYLQKDIIDRAHEGSICFLFQVQFFDIEKLRAQGKGEQKTWGVTDWVENGGLFWSEADMPFSTVAKIEIPEKTAPINCDEQYINTRLHSSRANQPVGSIARVRTLVEESSRARRMQ